MKDTILSVIRLIATPVLLMVLGLILLIHPDSASALVAQILGWVLVIAGVVFAVSAIAGHFDTVGKVLSAVCCFAVGAWLLRNPLMLAAGLGRLAVRQRHCNVARTVCTNTDLSKMLSSTMAICIQQLLRSIIVFISNLTGVLIDCCNNSSISIQLRISEYTCIYFQSMIDHVLSCSFI